MFVHWRKFYVLEWSLLGKRCGSQVLGAMYSRAFDCRQLTILTFAEQKKEKRGHFSGKMVLEARHTQCV